MTPTILIVEDDPFFSSLLTHKLKQDYLIVNKDNGLDAYSWIQTNNLPDLIIADLNIPFMDGYELIAKLKSDFHFSKIPIVIVSGEESALIKNRCYKAGANNFFAKPPNLNELAIVIKSLIEKNNSRKKSSEIHTGLK